MDDLFSGWARRPGPGCRVRRGLGRDWWPAPGLERPMYIAHCSGDGHPPCFDFRDPPCFDFRAAGWDDLMILGAGSAAGAGVQDKERARAGLVAGAGAGSRELAVKM